MRKIAAGFLSSGGDGKPKECLWPFEVLQHRMAAKRQGKMCKLFPGSSLVHKKQLAAISDYSMIANLFPDDFTVQKAFLTVGIEFDLQ